MRHQPVLFKEIIHALQPSSNGYYVDGTVGAGGHASGILEASAPGGRLLGLDRDISAIQLAEKNLRRFENRVVLIHSSYTEIGQHLKNLGWDEVDGILLDLGLSSMQLDSPGRGFSFLNDGPLDMRFDASEPLTAADLVNSLPEDDLADLIYQYGEEKKSRPIAKAIAAHRPVSTTRELAEIITGAVGYYQQRIHPATRTFQALRIAVNHELEALQEGLPAAVDGLKTGGRLAVIAFHSLEDRIVKNFIRDESRDCICPPEIPLCVCDHQARLKEISRGAVQPSQQEIENNPRARSARLRIAQKR